MPRRDWADAILAHPGGCVVCGRRGDVAHIIGRTFDRPKPGAKTLYVHPDSVTRLCGPALDPRSHHGAFDAHQLDLMPYLTAAQLAWCVARIGEGQAIRRISGRVTPTSAIR